MNIVDKIEIQHNLSYEFLASMFRLNCNEQLTKSDADDKFKFNEDILKWVDETRGRLPENIKASLDTFFNYETFFGMCLVDVIAENKPKDVEDFIDLIDNMPVESTLEEFMGSGYGIENNEPPSVIVKRMLSDEKYAIDFINKEVSVPAKQKWDFLQFFINPEKMKSDLLYLFKWYYSNVFKSEISKIVTVIDKYEKELLEKEKRYGKEYIEDLARVKYEQDDAVEHIVIAISYYYERCYLQASGKNIDIDLIGYRYIDIFEEAHNSIHSSLQVFKALADETRLNIIKLLAGRPWYGHEIAQKLGLSNSTVSHHLSQLTYSGLVKSERDDNRLYFNADIENIKKILCDSIDKMIK